MVSILCISLGASCASSSCGDLYLCVQLLSPVQMFATPWTIVHHASLSMELSRQQYWSGFPYSSPGDLPGSGIKLMSPALASGFFSTEPLGETSWGNQFSSIAQSCPTLCNPMNCSMPGLPVHHQLLEFAQTHVH